MSWTGDRRTRPRNGARRLPEKLRRRVLRRYPTCQLTIPGICTVTSTEVHHRQAAADFSPDDPNVDNEDGLVGVCSPCHRRVSACDSAARANLGTRVLREKEPHPGILP
ncbi:5-methylcytosine-specific restriction endonuclease McrA [Mycolicibacterium iranicum]|uniref:5-methylcytosine-specific restriction endonuclease McrA n=1 Tax=Mycolicibacterium iranicum TaxID=912594 RepID=A0A839Q7Q3_MYCIR|nr:HNH endonuclease [Mycolicibacterium iranicum]MBB2990256.1 5-methylcytosine-specific restriction endonuclease McrA [Mycolicibacterium iranicum]